MSYYVVLDWPATHYVNQTDLRLRELCLPESLTDLRYNPHTVLENLRLNPAPEHMAGRK